MKSLKKVLEKQPSAARDAEALLAVLGDEAALKKTRKALLMSEAGETVALILRVKGAPGLDAELTELMASDDAVVRVEGAIALLASVDQPR